jgi:hypothetical protein
MLAFPLYFALWIGLGLAGVVLGSIAVHRAERRARRLGAEAELSRTESVDAELVSAA